MLEVEVLGSVGGMWYWIIVRVSTRVVVVRELFSLMTAICVRIRGALTLREVRGYEDCLPHDSSLSSTAAFSPQ